VDNVMREYSSVERRYQRASCAFPAEFTWGSITHHGEILVISLGGCFLGAEAIVPPEEELDVAFRPDPEADPARCRARVVWTAARGVKIRCNRRARGFALEFLRIYPEDRARIDEYVKRQTRLFRSIEHELKKRAPDTALIKELFQRACPGESTHLSHVRKVCREEIRHFRLRK